MINNLSLLNETFTCDSLKELLYEFDTSTKTYTNNSKEFVNYWLCGTATEINWFDKSCQIGWDYLKDTCNISWSIITHDNNSYDVANEKLVTITNNKPNYVIMGLGYFFSVCTIFASFYYNFDTLKALYMYIDTKLYDFLCMFDFPGFMVERRSAMRLGPDFEFVVEHIWHFVTDPADDRLGLVHLATYTLHHNNFWIEFISLPPAWSIASYLNLIIVPGLEWPYNYDHFNYIELFHF